MCMSNTLSGTVASICDYM
ncbi:hypothetical protein F383_25408 [Gossypium arboreum]|uniref:Uncharacterized protein n=1 Tax=Gossypium arboreum TaxID=29729 RepID=A0A0B0P486_GOSAR|nr:hypothetical protein F383_25408 [Gossypium arboreum]